MSPLVTINLRRAYAAELEWFQREPHVAGYAADDGQIVLNPQMALSEPERACVVRNEAIRLFMQRIGLRLSFDVTAAQAEAFRGTAYEADLQALRETIIARLASGDPSAGLPTERQIGVAHALSAVFDCLVNLTCDEKADQPLLDLASSGGLCPGAQTPA